MRYFLFSVLLFGSISGLFGQKSIHFSLKPKTSEKKEIQLSQPNSDGLSDFKMLLNAEWTIEEETDRIRLTFDRTNSDGEGLLLCFPLMKDSASLNKMKACNSISKRIWKGKGAKSVHKIAYFIESDNIEKEYKDCYRFVAVNNKEDFEFTIKENTEVLDLSLTNLFVMREAKRPWYYFSKRDMKAEYRAEPINIRIKLNRPPVTPCQREDNTLLLKEINEKIVELEALHEKANEAKLSNNCYGQLKDIQNELKSDYPLEQTAWSDSECDEVQDLFSTYKKLHAEIASTRCKSTSSSSCPDLKRINKRLMDLQMKIYAKKKDGKDISKEKKEFLNIKNDTDKKITSDCNKDLLGSYKSFCTYIEQALGN